MSDRDVVRARLSALVVLILGPLLFGCLTLVLGQDANWDLKNYHWYNPYAYLTGRIGFDLLPAQIPSFYNPTLDIPFYLAATAWPAPVAGFLLGAVQGFNFVLLFGLAHALLRIPQPMAKVLWCTAIGLAGMLGAGSLGVLGTTFYDNVVSLFILGSLLWIVSSSGGAMLRGSLWRAAGVAAVGGLLAGTAMGLKQPYAMYCVALCLALLFMPVSAFRRLWLAGFFGVGVLLAVAAFAGPWMLYLWQEYGNPFFPHLNNLFQSPFAAISDYRHKDFIPESALDRLLLPFQFALDPLRVGEVWWRDFRIPVLFVLIPAAVLALAASRLGGRGLRLLSEPTGTRYLLVATAILYGLWVTMFCIYRYLIPVEMLAPLLIVLAIGLFPGSRQVRTIAAAFVLAVVQLTMIPAQWGRIPWTERWVEVSPVTIAKPEDTMILMAGYQPISYVIPALPPQAPVVRIQSNFLQPTSVGNAYLDIVRARVQGHRGTFLMLSTIPDTAGAALAARAFGLSIDPDTCQIVRTNLGEPLNLCGVQRETPSIG